MEFSIFLGLFLGVGGVLLGNLLEGGHIASLAQGTAAFIVFGGTFGAMIVSNRRADLARGLRLFTWAFKSEDELERRAALKQIVESAQLARRESILSLETRLPTFKTQHMRNVFRFMIDGVEAETLKDIFRNEAQRDEQRMLSGAKIWLDAGGFAPTIGIIGAVLGLIHVMANLTDTTALGKGIAVAFVATIYGVGSANLIFIPIANRLTRKIKEQTITKLMVIEGAVAILNGLNPYIIEEKLSAFLEPTESGKKSG